MPKTIHGHTNDCHGDCAGPGKFEGNHPQCLAQALYEASLDGCDDELGSVTENGIWWGLLASVDVDGVIYSAIVTEDSQGFVDVDYELGADSIMPAWVCVERIAEDEGIR